MGVGIYGRRKTLMKYLRFAQISPINDNLIGTGGTGKERKEDILLFYRYGGEGKVEAEVGDSLTFSGERFELGKSRITNPK